MNGLAQVVVSVDGIVVVSGESPFVRHPIVPQDALAERGRNTMRNSADDATSKKKKKKKKRKKKKEKGAERGEKEGRRS